MKIILYKCQICSTWFRPEDRRRCPSCAAIAIWNGSKLRHFSMSHTLGHIVPLVRGIRIPRTLSASARAQLEAFNAHIDTRIYSHTNAHAPRLVKRAS